MDIGRLKIKGKVILAPMCEVTFLPFRLLCKKYGAAIVYTEMIYADAYLYENIKTQKRSRFLDEERPIGIQIVGSSVEKLVLAAKKIEKELGPDIIDINFGCPAYNVIKTGSGSAIIRDIDKLHKIVNSISGSIKTPLTCKMRILHDDSLTIQATKIIEKAGAKALTVHGRTAKQGYSGRANWDIIKKIKKELSIPVILNGDIIDEESAKWAFDDTGCDAIMIGRAAIGDPYLFKRINHFLATGNKLNAQTFSEKRDVFIEIVKSSLKYGYENIYSLKLLAHNFTKGYPGASTIRKKITECNTLDEIVSLFMDLNNI